MEPKGTGLNKFQYFVANDLTSDWTELDDVRPIFLRAARQIRYIFTGDLKADIITNPHFPGKEKDFLRCQIARIVQNTTIIPDGAFKTVQDNPNEIEPIDEEAKKNLKTKDLIHLKCWVHSLPSILNEGRLIHKEREVPENVDAEKFKADYIAKDPFEKRLRPISDDKPLTSSIPKVKIPAWKIQFLYDDKIYINSNVKLNPPEEDPKNQKDNTANYTLICLRSLRWPGMYVIRFKNETYNYYFGWGHKFIDTTMGERFVFEKFPAINGDPEEIKICVEPNEPKEVPVVQENIVAGNENN